MTAEVCIKVLLVVCCLALLAWIYWPPKPAPKSDRAKPTIGTAEDLIMSDDD